MQSTINPTGAALGLITCLLSAPFAVAQGDQDLLREEVFAKGRWRSIGPANFGGRIVDIEADPTRRSTFYVAAASGGLHKTVNNGTTFESIFDSETAFSIGDVAIAPSDPDVLYVGTGEANNQRSSYWGDGVYKSTDAGRNWKHVGLNGTDHIGRIVVHPTNPDIVFVAAVGALYRPNPERGIYRTKDGGESFELVKSLGDDVGFIDLAIDPKNPDNVYAASYERRRRAHHFFESGPGSAIWKSTNGGNTWRKLEGGLPTGQIGRIGLAIYPRNPEILYALVENVNPAPPVREAPGRGDRGGAPRTASARKGAPPAPGDDGDQDGLLPSGDTAEAPAAAPPRPVGGEVYRTDDGGKSWTKVSSTAVGGRPHYYYGQVRVDPNDDQHLWAVGMRVSESRDGGRTWDPGFVSRLHGDHHALWIDPADSRHALLGNDGGLGRTWDGGKTWEYMNDLSLGQFYAIAVDRRVPYNVFGGTQDNGTWGIPSRSVTNQQLRKVNAFKIGGGDGFYVAVDPTDPDIIYSESQFGAISRLDLATGQRRGIRPRKPKGSPPLRFNWMSPIVISPHNPDTIWFGSQYLHRSRNRGDDWTVVSTDLTTNDPEKIKGNVPHCTITTISESPLAEGQVWVGTDDGKVWVTRNDGARWVDLSDRFPGLPQPLWVSRVETSHADPSTAYVAFTGYREDIRAPFLYMTTDGGETFVSIVNDLPAQASINVVREHPRNPNVLLVGTEFGVQVSVDGGGTWFPLGERLPTVAVHDLVVHPTEEDIVVGTHGRGLYVYDGTALAELGPVVLGEAFHVFRPRDGFSTRRAFAPVRYPAALGWRAERASGAPVFRYYLREDAGERVTIEVVDATGRQLFRRIGPTAAGLHEVSWAGGRTARATGRGAAGARGGQRGQRGAAGARGGQRGAAGARGGQRGGGASAPPSAGQFLLRVTHGETVVEHPFTVRAAPGLAGTETFGDDEVEADDERTPQWIW